MLNSVSLVHVEFAVCFKIYRNYCPTVSRAHAPKFNVERKKHTVNTLNGMLEKNLWTKHHLESITTVFGASYSTAAHRNQYRGGISATQSAFESSLLFRTCTETPQLAPPFSTTHQLNLCDCHISCMSHNMISMHDKPVGPFSVPLPFNKLHANILWLMRKAF